MISNDKIASLEKSKKLKKKIFGENIYRNYAIYPPSLIIFVGVLGIIYLFNLDKLISVYSIPFIIVFLLGTIWLKFAKKFLIDKKIKDADVFFICLPVLLKTVAGKEIILFAINKNRNNINYLEREKRDLLTINDIDSILSDVGTMPKQVNHLDVFLIKRTGFKKSLEDIKIIYTGKENVTKFISDSDLKKYI